MWSHIVSVSGYTALLSMGIYTHPEAEVEKMGMAYNGLDIREISEFLHNVKIGGRGRIYVCVRDTWLANKMPPALVELYSKDRLRTLNQTHWLIGVSAGESIEPYEDAARASSITLHAVNATDPIIRNTARYIDQYPGQYETLVNETTASVHQFDIGDGELFFLKVMVFETTNGVNWYTVLVIDRDYILGTVDRRTTEVSASIKEQESHIEDDLQQSRIVLYIVISVATSCLIVASMVVVFFIVAPLMKLERSMASVALMKLQDVDTTATSHLKEVSMMQASFYKMITNLKEFRNYLPHSILEEAEATDVTESSDVGQSNPNKLKSPTEVVIQPTSTPFTRSSVDANSKTSSHTYSEEGVLHGITDIRIKKISVLTINVTGFIDLPDCHVTHCKYLTIVLQNCKETKGVPESFTGDRVTVHWNALKAIPGHKNLASQCCWKVCSNAETDLQLKVTGAVAAGESNCGNMGVTGMKKYTFLGSLLPWVCVLERHNKVFNTNMLIDDKVNCESSHKFVTRLVERLRYRKHSRRPIPVFEVCNTLRAVESSEWMYEIEASRRSNPFLHINAATELYFDRNWSEALRYIEDHSNRSGMDYLKSFVVKCIQTNPPNYLPLYPELGLAHL
eukprot:TRINITY_DN13161_c0_g5_i2.p1 TRINITY_DN13161_c0_g5~~TRINITY_DN13161_c0_g5_i2.p1  ORF type:complete len:623 (+),score=79.34 TRINITY_DN13161_c0_g5_i2:857-2725(+)